MSKKVFTPLENLIYSSSGIRNRKFLTGFIFLIIFLAVFGFLFFNFRKTEKIEASPELKDVYGWAWSENIGWIRFRGKIPILDMNGLVAGYTLNEGSGTKIYDSSGNNNTGDLYNGPTWTTWNSDPYPYNTALQFDGVNDYAGVPDGPVSNLNITNAISIEAWIKGQAAGFTKTLRSGTGNTKNNPQFQVVGDKIYYVWSEAGSSGELWTGEMNTDGTGWQATRRTFSPTHKANPGRLLYPQLQVVGNKIHYVWTEENSVTSVNELWRGELDLSAAPPTWSEARLRENSYYNEYLKEWIPLPNEPLITAQLQVVGDKIYYVWVEFDGWTTPYIWIGKWDPAIPQWSAKQTSGFGWIAFSPQLQVVGNKIYYVFECSWTFPKRQICTAEANTELTGWNSGMLIDLNGPDFNYNKYYPQLQVVGNKIYYVYIQNYGGSISQIFTAEMDIGSTGYWTPIKRTSTSSDKYSLQFQVVGNKIYYAWGEEWKIMTAEMNIDGTGGFTNITQRASGPPMSQFQVVGSKSYFVWVDSVWEDGHWADKIHTGEMNSNLINKGDFYGLGVKDGKVIGFINAGVDGFKYTGNPTADTAGATVNLTLPDSNWHHLVATYDKTNLSLYLDGGTLAGGQEASVPYSAIINSNPFPLIIGDDFNGTIDENFNGTIDEIRIYNKALNATDVKAHFEGTTYGVSIEDNPSSSTYGYLSGYAWSEHIGWISFNSADLIGCPSGACEAKVDLTSTGTVCGGAGWVCGWARALVDGGGWDGWIKLRGTATDGSPYGVWLDTSISPHEFKNFAWGSDVVGWISFNCKEGGYNEGTGQIFDICSTSNYQVKTSLFLNYKPTASDLSLSSKYCDVNPGVGQISFSWLYEDHEKSPQSNYRLEIATDPVFNSKVVDYEIPQIVASGGTGSSSVLVVSDPSTYSRCIGGGDYKGRCIQYGGAYYWRISVKDGLQWSDPPVEGPSFTTPLHAKPWVDFQWCPLKPEALGFTRFCSIEEATKCETATTCVDASSPSRPPIPVDVTCYNSAGGEVGCVSWSWILTNANPGTSSDKNPLVRFASMGFWDVSLKVTDAEGLFCTKTLTMSVEIEYPLPQWKEIPPF
jgi:hypothetical protein